MAQAQPVELFMPGPLCLFGEHRDWAAQLAVRGPAAQDAVTDILQQRFAHMMRFPLSITAAASGR